MRWAFFHFDHALDPRGLHSGAEQALFATARALAARGHRVRVLGRLAADATVDGVEYLCAGPPGGFDVATGVARVAGDCDVLVSTLRADVLEAGHDVPFRVWWPNVVSPEAAGAPVARLIAACDRVVAVSRFQAGVFARAGVPEERIAVVPNGLDAEVFAPDPAATRVPHRIVFAGALVWDKGLDVLLNALPAIRALVPDAELVVCGSSRLWGRDAYLDEAAARALPGVRFAGALERRALADEFRRAALCVVPTPPERWLEACPLVPVEAQACGTPVVVSRSGGMVETLRDGETGWMVDPVTPQTLAAAVVTALRDPARLARMGEAAARFARAEFSWARNAETWEALVRAPAPATDRPRVALLTTWQQRCGLARYAEQLVAAAPAGSVRVWAEITQATVPSEAPAVPVERVWRRGERLLHLAERAEREGIRLVHVNHHGGLFGAHVSELCGALAGRGIRSVVTMHAPNQLDAEIAAIGRAADAIVVHGAEIRLEVIGNGVAPARVHVIPQGVPAPASGDASATRQTMGLPPGEKLVASVGFLQPHKGVHEVIRAVAAVRRRVPLQYLVLGGPLPGDPTGPAYRDQCLAEAERLGVRDALTIVEDYLPERLVMEYLRAADVIVLPYATHWWEASAAARQALASGRPVVTSPALAFHDLGPAVFRTTGAFHLAQAIESVLTEPALAGELVAAAQALAARDAWPVVAARHRALWDEVLARPAAAVASDVPRVLVMVREHASRTGGGDFVGVQKVLRGADPRRVAVVCREGGQVTAEADLVHLVNFCTYEATHAHARRAVELGLPYVVSGLYEDWPRFKLAAELAVQRARTRLGLPPSVDLEAYARMYEREQRDLLERCAFVATHARLVSATGAEEEARLRRDFPGIRTRVIHAAVPARPAGDADAFRAKFGTRDFVLCVGRIEPRKNQLALLEALADDPVDVVLATGGFAYRQDYLEACQRFRRRGRTLYLPALTDRELAGAYAAARVHVIPSWFELPGFITLEALAAGSAVVATDRGTLRDHLGDTIPWGAPDDVERLRRAIEAAAGWDWAAARARVRALSVEGEVEAWTAAYEDNVRTPGGVRTPPGIVRSVRGPNAVESAAEVGSRP